MDHPWWALHALVSSNPGFLVPSSSHHFFSGWNLDSPHWGHPDNTVQQDGAPPRSRSGAAFSSEYLIFSAYGPASAS